MRNNPHPSRARLFSRGRSPAQALLEFTLALPILLLAIFAIIDFALLFQAWLSVENMARQTIRFAVTGEYDPTYCTDLDGDGTPCGGDRKNDEQDAARLSTIKDVANSWSIGLFRSSTLAQTDAGYFKLTICSSRDRDGNLIPDYVTVKPQMGANYAECLLNGAPVDDAGGPGDRVAVMVDFNHPYITPFIRTLWPWVHLASYREGIVEEFRVARVIAVQPQLNVPTTTPQNTLPPTSTSRPSATQPPPSATIARTPTRTSSPTITPTPDCSLFNLAEFTSGFNQTNWGSPGRPRVRIGIRNKSTQDTYVKSVAFIWQAYDASNPGQTLDRWRFNGGTIVNTDDPDSPTTWALSGPPSSNLLLRAKAARDFDFDYLNPDPAWPGIVITESFGMTVTLTNGCMLSRKPEPTPAVSRTPTLTRTATMTRPPTLTRTPTEIGAPTQTPRPTRTPQPTITPFPTIVLPPTNTPGGPTSTKPPTPRVTPTPTATICFDC